MDEQTLQLLYALIQGAPGKTPAQRLNYLQDISGSLGIDLFGGGRDYVPGTFTEEQNIVGETYGNDPVAAAIFNSINSNMSPIQAYQSADEAGLIPKDTMGDPTFDYLKLATDYAEAEAKRRVAASQFQQQDALNRQIFEAGQKPGLQDLFGENVYEAAGAPSEAKLMQQYLDTLKPKRAASATPSALSGGRTVERLRNAASAAGAPVSARGLVEPGLERFAEGVARSRAKQQVGEMQKRFRPTDRSQDLQYKLALIQAIGGG
jgi:hypothetical protein